jgi:chromosome segregation ATPase
MNDTPVTDAFFYKKGCWSEDILAFCRRLERERDEARQQYDDLATEHVLAINKLAEERDQAKADAARIADILSGLELRSTDELASLDRERNEARAERDILRLDAQREAEHHDRMVGELQRLYAKLEEARAITDELAAIAAHCLGSHSFALSDTAIKISAALKRWKKNK